ncbi:MAG: PEP-CTERM sorting domain-containing protein [Bryobacterales bacterium]|nr:PEP-CTERM sorting domain-containing protein [Bryobacterales bacterium]
MNRFTTTAALALCVGMLAQADTITFASQGTAADANEWNALGDTLVITPHGNWATALAGSEWVSYGPTGKPFVGAFTLTPHNYVLSFFERLLLPEAPLSAAITIRADDSAALYINDVLVQPEAPQAGNVYFICSDFAIGCREQTQLTLDIGSYLNQGVNTLRFDVAQRAGWSFGLNYSGSVEYVVSDDEAATPEPATFGLIGVALVAAGLWRRR